MNEISRNYKKRIRWQPVTFWIFFCNWKLWNSAIFVGIGTWLCWYLFFSSYLILGDYIFKRISKAGHFLRINPGSSQSVRHSKVCQYKYRRLIDDPSPRYSILFVCKGHVNIPASIANSTRLVPIGIHKAKLIFYSEPGCHATNFMQFKLANTDFYWNQN